MANPSDWLLYKVAYRLKHGSKVGEFQEELYLSTSIYTITKHMQASQQYDSIAIEAVVGPRILCTDVVQPEGTCDLYEVYFENDEGTFSIWTNDPTIPMQDEDEPLKIELRYSAVKLLFDEIT